MAEKIRELNLLNEKHKHQLAQLLRHRFGQRADRISSEQLVLWVLEATEDASAAPEKPGPPAASGGPRGRGHGRRPLPKDLPRKRVVHDVAPEEKICPRCQEEKRKIGEEVSEQLEYVPASFYVIENVRPKYVCVHCEEGVVQGRKPMQAIEKGLPGPGFLAHVVTSKYADHLPLYRLEGIFARHGVEIRRSTMCGWMAYTAELLAPLYERMCRAVLSSKVIFTDDTPTPVQDRDLTRTRTGRIWVYVGDRQHRYTVYDYTADRSRDGPARFLEGFSGYLQADAYPGYDALYRDGRIKEVGCWAHSRRRYVEAEMTHPVNAAIAVAWIRRLYRLEDAARRMDPASRQALRQQRAKPILEGFKEWLDRTVLEVLPKSPLGQAIGYTLSNWAALNRYLEDGDLEIDNGRAERALKPTALGRKNWLFFGSDRGGQTGAILKSFTATCKDLKIDPFVYLRDIFERISAHPMNRLDELLPDRWLAERIASAQDPAA
ncbi:MAG: IS66 family transposase [bacterium]